MYASILLAETFGIPIPDWAKDPTKFADAVDKVTVPEFQTKQNAKAVDKVTDDKATSPCVPSVGDKKVIKELFKKLEHCRTSLPSDFRMKPVQFEKDDDTNHHMDLIVALANLRARNYSIPEVDKLKAKIIAGKLLPAIATSTAMATGLVCLELYKVLDGGHNVEDYHNTFANLALPFFSMAEPLKPKVQKHRDNVWTGWDRWTVEGNPSLREFLQWFKANKGLNACRIWSGNFLLFNKISPLHEDRIDKKVVDLLRDVTKVEPPPYRRHFDVVVSCLDDEGGFVDIPQVSVYFR